MAEALKQIEFTVDGQKYITAQLGAVEGRRLFVDLFKAIAPALESINIGLGDKKFQEQALISAASDIISNLDSALIDKLCDTFGPKTRAVLGPQQEMTLDSGYFSLHFAAKYVQMFKWIYECCKANGFLSFLPGN